MNRRVEIILERHRYDYPLAMGELNIRRVELKKRLDNGAYGRIRGIITNEYNDIVKLLSEYQKPTTNDSKDHII